jgi:hypothetical protein
LVTALFCWLDAAQPANNNASVSPGRSSKAVGLIEFMVSKGSRFNGRERRINSV